MATKTLHPGLHSGLRSGFLSGALALALAAIVAGTGAPAQAQIEEIVVTATKREQSVQDVPIAVTALTEVQLQRAGVKDLRDLAQIAPSFNMNSSQTESQGTTLRIRGVGTTGNNIGLESAVGVFLDGVYLSRPGVALGDLLDTERLEVLRGPQGTLFGRNTSAGALAIHTKKPLLEGSEYWLNAGVGNYAATNVQLGGSTPLVEGELGLRLAAAFRNQDGFTDGPGDNQSYTRDRHLLRAQLLWQPNEDLSVRIIADHSQADEACCDGGQFYETPFVAAGAYAAAGLPADGGNPGAGTPENYENRRTYSNDEFQNEFKQGGVSAEINYALGENADLVYIGSYRDFLADSVQDDFSGVDVYGVPEASDEIVSSTHELRFQGSAFDGFADWMVGAFYSDEEITEVFTLELGPDFQAYTDAVLIGAAGGAPLAGTALRVAGGVDADLSFAENHFNQQGTSWSLFTHNTFHLAEQWNLVIGLRWINEEKDGRFEQPNASSQACLNTIQNAGTLGALAPLAIGFGCFPFAAQANVPLPPPVDILPRTFDSTFEDDELTYTAKMVWAITDDVNSYASVTHGFKAGGYNLDATAAVGGADPRFRSETTDAYELGLKSTLLENTLRLNAAVFLMEMEDFQVLEFTGTQFQTFNVPEAESTGAELEATWQPTEGLAFNFAFTYADANYPDSCAGGLTTPQVITLCGFPLTNAPEWVGSWGVNYEGELPLSGLGYFLNMAWRHSDERRTSTQPQTGAGALLIGDVQESYYKANLRAGIFPQEGAWAFEVWGNNVFDEQTRNVTFNVPLRGFGSLAARGVFYEAPRTFGATLRLQY